MVISRNLKLKWFDGIPFLRMHTCVEKIVIGAIRKYYMDSLYIYM